MSSSSVGAATGSPTGLLSLPPTLLQRILSLVLQEDPSLSLALISSLGSHIAQHGGLPILLQSITLVDDDALLVDCEQATDAAPLVAQTPLKAVWLSPSKAELVKHLVVVKPPPLDYSTTTLSSAPLGPTSPTPQDALSRQSVDDDDEEQDDDQLGLDLLPPPLEDTSFLLLLTKLSALRTLHWSTARLPPSHLCPALGAACKSLTEFRFELAEVASTSTGDGAAGVGSPRIGGGGGAASGADKLRWDAPDLSALPLSLTTLSLSNLSQLGTRSLASALPSLPNLEDLELARTVFVDDEVMAEIGASARKLRKLKIREMSGTKLSEGGLTEVLEGCIELEMLVLDCVEGRFSKSCWTKLTPLPPQLTTLAIHYAEPSPHKSWTLDHLLSLPSALPTSSLTTLIVSRKPDPGALIPGRHHHSRYPVDQVMVPKPVGDELVQALLERGEEWRVLELDLWKMGSDELKKVMEGCAGLIKLKILFDAPFRGLLTLASSFALSQNLRHFLLSIDPSHTPELNSMNFVVTPPKGSKATSLPPTPGASPSSTLTPLPTIPADADLQFPASPPSPTSMRSPTLGGRRGSLGAVLGMGSNLGPNEGGGQVVTTASYAARSPINTREWRRFLKKTHRLEDIEWYGRGGIGRWRFERGHGHVGGGGIGVGKVEVELEPIVRRVGANGEDMEAGLRSPELGGGGGSVAWRCENRRRRSSSASLAGSCLSTLGLSDASPTSPTLSQSQDDYGSPKTARSSGGFSSTSRGSNGLGLTGLSPATPATGFGTSLPTSTSPTTSYGHHFKSPSPSTAANPTPSRPPLKTSTSTGGAVGGAPVVYPGGWHSGGASKQSPSSFGAIGAKVNLDKEKERHLEREREKERQRVKERQAEAQENAFPPLSPTTSTAVGGGGGTASSSRSTSGRSSKTNSPVLSTGSFPPSTQPPTQPQSPTTTTSTGAGKGRGGGKAGRGGATGGQAAGERVIPGLPSSLQGQGQKRGGGRGRK